MTGDDDTENARALRDSGFGPAAGGARIGLWVAAARYPATRCLARSRRVVTQIVELRILQNRL